MVVKGTPAWLVGIQRSIGASLDFTSIVLLALSPWFFKFVSGKLNPDAVAGIIRTDIVLLISICLALSPLSLIYLRIVFHKIMHSPTPGELISGFVSSTNSNGLQGIIQEASYGLAQYFAISITGGQSLLLIAIFLFMGTQTTLFIQNNFLAFTAATILSLILMSRVYWPRSKTSYQSFLDDQCNVVVQRLR